MARSFIIGFMFVVTIILGWGNVSAATNVSSCTTISAPGVYLLNQSINSSSTCIIIESSDVIFDGQGYTIDGTGSYYGVYVYNSSATLTNVTVRNVTVTDWGNGIYYQNVERGSIEDNTVSGNWADGIVLSSSNNNTLEGNTANSNYYGIWLSYSSNNTLKNNTASSNFAFGDGIGIYFTSSSNNTITDNTANSNDLYGIYLEESSDNTLTNNIASNNYEYGILLYSSSSNNIKNNNASNNYDGIHLSYSSNNTITDNTANSNNYYGIYLISSSSNTLTNNNASNNGYGISIYSYSSSNNNITGNTASSNNNYGIYLGYSSNSSIYNNLFNNTNNFYFTGTIIYNNTWNTTKTLSTNIIGGPYLGGNVWAYPNGTGFSETCTDADSDGICDNYYNLTSGNVDYLPLSLNFTVDTTPPTITIYSPTNATINDSTPDLNLTTDESSYITYTWDGEGNITGCQNCTSYLTTYGEYANTSDQNLVGLWHFNENHGTISTDDSNNGNDGTITGAAWTAGKFGNALEFDGVDDYVGVPDTPELRFTIGTPLTLEAWVKINTLKTNPIIIKPDETSSTEGYQFLVNSDGKLFFGIGGWGFGWNMYVFSTNTVPVNQWTHVAVVYSGSDIADLYINGQLETPSSTYDTGSAYYPVGTTPLLIGSGRGHYFNGTIDEVAIWNSALSAGEIYDLYSKHLEDDLHNVTVYANDTDSNLNSTTVWFSVDTISPTITIDSPTNKTYTTTSVDLNVSASENIDTWMYSLDGGNNVTFSPNITLGENWWNSSWQYRQVINITNNNDSSVLQEGYTVNITLNTTQLILDGKMNPTGNDVRIVWYNSTSGENVELDRLNLSAFNKTDGTNTAIVFKLQQNISADGWDADYSLYYGNPSAGAPPADGSNVYLFWDDFSTNTSANYLGNWTWDNADGSVYRLVGQTWYYAYNSTAKNVVIDAVVKVDSSINQYGQPGIGFYGDPTFYTDNFYFMTYNYYNRVFVRDYVGGTNYGGDWTGVTTALNTWYDFRLTRFEDLINFKFKERTDAVWAWSTDYTLNTNFENRKPTLTSENEGVRIDFWKVRKYLSPEPITSLGGEEIRLGDGPHTITVYANDTAGNMNSSTVWFTVKTLPTKVSSCGTTISMPGVYLLNTTIGNYGGGACIIIESSDVIFDGQGHTIDGTGSYYGVYVYNSSATLTNVMVRNVTVTDWDRGIYYRNAENGSITNNIVSNNYNGIRLDSSSSNTISNNLFNNSNNFDLYSSTNSWNTTKTAGTNIVSGPYLGGNFWAKPDGTGFSETCTDVDSDRICDSNYTLASGNIDYLSLVLPGIIYDPINYVITVNGGGIPVCDSQNPCNFESILDSVAVPLDIYNATKSVDGKNLVFYSKARIVINKSAVFSSQNEVIIFDYNQTNNKFVIDNYGDFTLGENQSGYPSKGSAVFVNVRDISPAIHGINCRRNSKCSIYNSEITVLNQRVQTVSGANYSVARRALDIHKVSKGEFKNIIIRNWAGMATWDANNPAIVDGIDIYDCGLIPGGRVQSYHDMASWITPNRNIRIYNCGSGAQAHGYQISTVKSYNFWIYNAQNYDLEPFNDASKPLTWKVVDFHFNASKIKIWQDIHNIQEYYTANLKVTNSTNTPLQGCNASWYITNGTYQLVYSGLTDSNGEIPQQEIINRQWSGSAMTLANYNPQRLKVTCSGYNTYDKAFNLTAMSNYWYANNLKKGINWEIALG